MYRSTLLNFVKIVQPSLIDDKFVDMTLTKLMGVCTEGLSTRKNPRTPSDFFKKNPRTPSDFFKKNPKKSQKIPKNPKKS